MAPGALDRQMQCHQEAWTGAKAECSVLLMQIGSANLLSALRYQSSLINLTALQQLEPASLGDHVQHFETKLTQSYQSSLPKLSARNGQSLQS